MDRQEALFSLKARLQLELSLGSAFSAKLDHKLLPILHAIPETRKQTPASVLPIRPDFMQHEQHHLNTVSKNPPSMPRFATVKRHASLVPEVDVAVNPDKERQLAALLAESRNCMICGLCERRLSVVWGEGSLDAGVMFIGEGPGRDEDEQGRPFVGRSGRLLTDIIEKGMKMPRGQVYITNVVKCRPPGNRDPKPEEVEACSRYLKKQIEVIGPKVIVAVGGVAGCALLGLPPKSPGLRGEWHQYDGIPMRVIYHPSYLLRQRGQGNQRTRADQETWKDIQLVMGLLTQKQS